MKNRFLNLGVVIIGLLTHSTPTQAITFKDTDVSAVQTVKRNFRLLDPTQIPQTLQHCKSTYLAGIPSELGGLACRCEITASTNAVHQLEANASSHLQLLAKDYQTFQKEYLQVRTLNNRGDLSLEIAYLSACGNWSKVEPYIKLFLNELTQQPVSTVVFRSKDIPLENTPDYSETALVSKTYGVHKKGINWLDLAECERNWKLIPKASAAEPSTGYCENFPPLTSEVIRYVHHSLSDSYYLYANHVITPYTRWEPRSHEKNVLLFSPHYSDGNGRAITFAVRSDDQPGLITSWLVAKDAAIALNQFLTIQEEDYWTDTVPTPGPDLISHEVRVITRSLDLSSLNDFSNLESNWKYNQGVIQFFSDFSQRSIAEQALIDSPSDESHSLSVTYAPISNSQPILFTLKVTPSSAVITADSEQILSWEEAMNGIGALLYQYSQAPFSVTLMK